MLPKKKLKKYADLKSMLKKIGFNSKSGSVVTYIHRHKGGDDEGVILLDQGHDNVCRTKMTSSL